MSALLTAKDLAAQISMTENGVERLARLGAIPALRLSPKVIRFSLDDVLAALRQRADGPEKMKKKKARTS